LYSNLLTNLDLSQNFKLEELNIDNNNFSEQDLSFLGHLSKLKKIWLGNNIEWRISQGIYNRFVGSLKFLKEMEKLELCDISNTDLDDDLEVLSKGINDFRNSNNYLVDKDERAFLLKKELDYDQMEAIVEELAIS